MARCPRTRASATVLRSVGAVGADPSSPDALCCTLVTLVPEWALHPVVGGGVTGGASGSLVVRPEPNTHDERCAGDICGQTFCAARTMSAVSVSVPAARVSTGVLGPAPAPAPLAASDEAHASAARSDLDGSCHAAAAAAGVLRWHQAQLLGSARAGYKAREYMHRLRRGDRPPRAAAGVLPPGAAAPHKRGAQSCYPPMAMHATVTPRVDLREYQASMAAQAYSAVQTVARSGVGGAGARNVEIRWHAAESSSDGAAGTSGGGGGADSDAAAQSPVVASGFTINGAASMATTRAPAAAPSWAIFPMLATTTAADGSLAPAAHSAVQSDSARMIEGAGYVASIPATAADTMREADTADAGNGMWLAFRYHAPSSLALYLYDLAHMAPQMDGNILLLTLYPDLFWSAAAHWRDAGSVLPWSKASRRTLEAAGFCGADVCTEGGAAPLWWQDLAGKWDAALRCGVSGVPDWTDCMWHCTPEGCAIHDTAVEPALRGACESGGSGADAPPSAMATAAAAASAALAPVATVCPFRHDDSWRGAVLEAHAAQGAKTALHATSASLASPTGSASSAAVSPGGTLSTRRRGSTSASDGRSPSSYTGGDGTDSATSDGLSYYPEAPSPESMPSSAVAFSSTAGSATGSTHASTGAGSHSSSAGDAALPRSRESSADSRLSDLAGTRASPAALVELGVTHLCVSCGLSLPRGEFSHRQMKRGRSQRRCRACVEPAEGMTLRSLLATKEGPRESTGKVTTPKPRGRSPVPAAPKPTTA